MSVDFVAARREVDELFGELLRARGDSIVGALVSEIGKRLASLLEAEESAVIPRVAQWNQREARTLLAEHTHLRARWREVVLAHANAEAVETFVDDFNAHSRHEEAVLARWADERPGDVEQMALARAPSDAARRY